MRALFTACVLWSTTAFPALADPDKIQAIIDRQLDAFQANNFARAMEFASPNLQQYFRTPQNFEQMVTRGYPMVWRFESMRFLENRVEDGVHWQRVMFTDLDGVRHILDYRMLETEAGWRINGVMILDAADFTV